MIKMTHARPWWRKSTYSNGQASCVEVGHDAAQIAVRDTKDPGGPALAFTPAGLAGVHPARPGWRSRPLTRRRRAPRQLQGWRGALVPGRPGL